MPQEQWAHTPVQLMATAGLRLLANGTQEKLLAESRKLLSSSGLQFEPDWAQVLSGEEEGIFTWLGVNYATGEAARASPGVPARAAPGVPATQCNGHPAHTPRYALVTPWLHTAP